MHWTMPLSHRPASSVTYGRARMPAPTVVPATRAAALNTLPGRCLKELSGSENSKVENNLSGVTTTCTRKVKITLLFRLVRQSHGSQRSMYVAEVKIDSLFLGRRSPNLCLEIWSRSLI